MGKIYLIGEDALSCALGGRLVTEILGWSLAQPAVNTAGVTQLKKSIPRYVQLARVHPVLCLADTDRGCAVRLKEEWLKGAQYNQFILRFAVTESESWLIADREALADFFELSLNLVPMQPDDEFDAKRVVLNLARRSRRRCIRQELISQFDPNKPGVGYNIHLCEFVNSRWRPEHAASRSPSLARAIQRLSELKEQYCS